MDLVTPLETYCRLILRAREMEAQVPADDPDQEADNVDDVGDDDDANQALSVLQDEMNDVEEEVVALLDDLADDQLTECLALAWVGAGTYDVSEWEDATAEADDLDMDERVDELMNMPALAGHLEAGLAAFDYNCDALGQND